MEFYEAARAAGVKPIIGVEIVYGTEQCVLLAMDQRGYVNLCRIVTVAGWLVTSRRAVTLARDYMKFLTLEDRYGVMEAALFPDVYRRSVALLTGPGCYLVRGIVRARHGVATIIADELQALRPIAIDFPGNFWRTADTHPVRRRVPAASHEPVSLFPLS